MVDLQTLLYAAEVGVFFTFAVACVWRAYENHLHHEGIRYSLLVFALMLALLAALAGIRVQARLIDDLALSRATFDTWYFIASQLGVVLSAVWLFLLLQKPRDK